MTFCVAIISAHIPSQSRVAVHSHTAARLFFKLVLQQIDPILHYLLRGSRTIFIRPILQSGFILFSTSTKLRNAVVNGSISPELVFLLVPAEPCRRLGSTLGPRSLLHALSDPQQETHNSKTFGSLNLRRKCHESSHRPLPQCALPL